MRAFSASPSLSMRPCSSSFAQGSYGTPLNSMSSVIGSRPISQQFRESLGRLADELAQREVELGRLAPCDEPRRARLRARVSDLRVTAPIVGGRMASERG